MAAVLQFHEGVYCGAEFTTYLLEAKRVLGHLPGDPLPTPGAGGDALMQCLRQNLVTCEEETPLSATMSPLFPPSIPVPVFGLSLPTRFYANYFSFLYTFSLFLTLLTVFTKSSEPPPTPGTGFFGMHLCSVLICFNRRNLFRCDWETYLLVSPLWYPHRNLGICLALCSLCLSDGIFCESFPPSIHSFSFFLRPFTVFTKTDLPPFSALLPEPSSLPNFRSQSFSKTTPTTPNRPLRPGVQG